MRCPVCGAEFAVSEAPVQALPEAEVILSGPEDERKMTVNVEPDGAAKPASVADGAIGHSEESLDQWEQLRAELSPQAGKSIEEKESDEATKQAGETLAKLTEKMKKPTLSSLIEKSEAEEETEEQFVQHDWEQIPDATDSAAREEPQAESPKRSLEEMLAEFRKPVEEQTIEPEHVEPKTVEPAGAETAGIADASDTEQEEAGTVEPASLFQSRLSLPSEADKVAETPAVSEAEAYKAVEFDHSLEHTVRSLEQTTSSRDTEEPASSSYESRDAIVTEKATDSISRHSYKTYQDEPLDLRIDSAERQRSLKPLAKVAAGGLLGCLGLAYSLLWIAGPRADLLQMGRWAPQAMLPASMRSQTEMVAAREKSVPEEPADQPGTQSADKYLAGASPLQQDRDDRPTELPVDSEVAPASAVTPAAGQDDDAQASELLKAGQLSALLVSPRAVSTAALAEAVAEARAALPDLLTGNLSDANSIARKGGAYKSFAKLAECVALAGASGSGGQVGDDSDFVIELAEGKQLLRRAISDKYERDEVSQIAARWTEYTKRPSSGIAFVGTIIDVRAVGALTEYLVEIRWQDEQLAVPVLMPRLRFTTGDQIGVVGVVAANPRESLRGYEGDAPQTIVADDSFLLEE
ncbi:MAG: hypothetical protein RIB44_00920 [Lacipirellulaceae bacterium]